MYLTSMSKIPLSRAATEGLRALGYPPGDCSLDGCR